MKNFIQFSAKKLTKNVVAMRRLRVTMLSAASICITTSVMTAMMVLDVFAQSSAESITVTKPSLFKAAIAVDVHSSLVWRGIVLERNPVVQPSLLLRYEHFQIGFFGTHTFGGGFNATVLQMQYAIVTPFGTFTPALTDYYFPSSRQSYFSLRNDGTGAHTVEASLSYTAPAAVPLQLFAAANIYNDPRTSAYCEASYPFVLNEKNDKMNDKTNDKASTADASAVPAPSIVVFVGAVLTPQSAWYSSPHNPHNNSVSGVSGVSGISAVGIRASYAIALTERWSLPLAVAFVLNPSAQHAYVVASVGLR
jgi:hypothetical protein